MSEKERRRELGLGIDSLIEEMNGMYGTELKEEEAIERKLSDIRLRRKLEVLVGHVARFVKIAERRRDEELMDISYTALVTINSDGVEFEVKSRNP